MPAERRGRRLVDLPTRQETVVDRLANGLTVAIVPDPHSAVVASALCYRTGARYEIESQQGIAHFLEHMMFKGSPAFGPGEIDRRTQALGGWNNAFTTHDATVYEFGFAADRWDLALDMEADRLAELTLDPAAVEAEGRVIEEEIHMYMESPWEVLDQRVHERLFAGHPYGRAILGTLESVGRIDRSSLADFHHRYYRPERAVLVLAGAVDRSALERIADRFRQLQGGGAEAPPASPRARLAGLERLAVHQGEVERLLLALPVPAASHPDYPALRLLVTVLGGGRLSRLHRALVEEGQLCSSASVDLGEGLDPTQMNIALELVPGVETERVEAVLFAELAAVRSAPVSPEELASARRILLADWLFAHQRPHERAVTAGLALTLFDLDFPERVLSRALACEQDELLDAAARYLDPERESVLGRAAPRPAGQEETA